jgi:hypothetical protein
MTTKTKPKLHVYHVWVAKNLYYSIYVEAKSAKQAESATGCAAMSKVDTDAITEEMEDEVYNVEQVPESECLPEDADIRYTDIVGEGV